MKKIIVISIVLVGLAFGFAYAHNNGGLRGGFGNGGHMMGGGYGHGAHMMGDGHMMGPGMMRGYGGNSNYSDCPGWSSFRGNGWNSEIHQRYLQDTVGLRKELNDKRFEYMEARRNPASSADQLAALEREISDLQLEMQKEAEQYN